MSQGDDYKVGYGKPPQSGKFQKGNQGPRKGRRKGSKNIDTLLAEMFRSRTRISINGVPKLVPVQEALVHRIKKEMLTGPIRSMERGLEIARRLSPPDTSEQDSRKIAEALADLTDEEFELYTMICTKVYGEDAMREASQGLDDIYSFETPQQEDPLSDE